MSENKDLHIFGNRLRTARKMAGLSMNDLVKKMGRIVTKQAISKYEAGKMKPASKILIQLASALDVKPEYFFRNTKIEISKIHFRKRANLPAKIKESLKEKTIDFLERYIELENILGIQKKFKNPVKNSVINDIRDVEKASLEVRDKWKIGLSPITNLLELLEENGIKIFEVNNIDDFDGLSASLKNIHVIVINNSLPTDRIRFTAAHELAHILCEFPKESQKEKLCHAFAGAFLLPKASLEKELMRKREHISLWELEEIKQIYGISIQAIVKRAQVLGIVSDFYFRNFQAMLNQKGWKKEEYVEYKGREAAKRFKQLLHYAISEEIITLSRGAELANIRLSELKDNVRAAI